MEDIEYLEEYEDLILPTIQSNANAVAFAVKNTMEDEDSSSIDQDIFESLFDDHSDDEIAPTVPKKVDPKLSQRRSDERASLDSLDLLVRDLVGEKHLERKRTTANMNTNVNESLSKAAATFGSKRCVTNINVDPSIGRSTEKIVNSSSSSYHKMPMAPRAKPPPMSKYTATEQNFQKRSPVLPRSECGSVNPTTAAFTHILRNETNKLDKSKSVATVRPTVQNRQQQLQKRFTSTAVMSNRNNSSCAVTKSNSASVTSSMGRKQTTSVGPTMGSSRALQRPPTTIVKPEKRTVHDPLNDPLNLDEISDDTLATDSADSFILSDLSDESLDSLSDLDDVQDFMDDSSKDTSSIYDSKTLSTPLNFYRVKSKAGRQIPRKTANRLQMTKRQRAIPQQSLGNLLREESSTTGKDVVNKKHCGALLNHRARQNGDDMPLDKESFGMSVTKKRTGPSHGIETVLDSPVTKYTPSSQSDVFDELSEAVFAMANELIEEGCDTNKESIGTNSDSNKVNEQLASGVEGTKNEICINMKDFSNGCKDTLEKNLEEKEESEVKLEKTQESTNAKDHIELAMELEIASDKNTGNNEFFVIKSDGGQEPTIKKEENEVQGSVQISNRAISNRLTRKGDVKRRFLPSTHAEEHLKDVTSLESVATCSENNDIQVLDRRRTSKKNKLKTITVSAKEKNVLGQKLNNERNVTDTKDGQSQVTLNEGLLSKGKTTRKRKKPNPMTTNKVSDNVEGLVSSSQVMAASTSVVETKEHTTKKKKSSNKGVKLNVKPKRTSAAMAKKVKIKLQTIPKSLEKIVAKRKKKCLENAAKLSSGSVVEEAGWKGGKNDDALSPLMEVNIRDKLSKNVHKAVPKGGGKTLSESLKASDHNEDKEGREYASEENTAVWEQVFHVSGGAEVITSHKSEKEEDKLTEAISSRKRKMTRETKQVTEGGTAKRRKGLEKEKRSGSEVAEKKMATKEEASISFADDEHLEKISLRSSQCTGDRLNNDESIKDTLISKEINAGIENMDTNVMLEAVEKSVSNDTDNDGDGTEESIAPLAESGDRDDFTRTPKRVEGTQLSEYQMAAKVVTAIKKRDFKRDRSGKRKEETQSKSNEKEKEQASSSERLSDEGNVENRLLDDKIVHSSPAGVCGSDLEFKTVETTLLSLQDVGGRLEDISMLSVETYLKASDGGAKSRLSAEKETEMKAPLNAEHADKFSHSVRIVDKVRATDEEEISPEALYNILAGVTAEESSLEAERCCPNAREDANKRAGGRTAAEAIVNDDDVSTAKAKLEEGLDESIVGKKNLKEGSDALENVSIEPIPATVDGGDGKNASCTTKTASIMSTSRKRLRTELEILMDSQPDATTSKKRNRRKIHVTSRQCITSPTMVANRDPRGSTKLERGLTTSNAFKCRKLEVRVDRSFVRKYLASLSSAVAENIRCDDKEPPTTAELSTTMYLSMKPFSKLSMETNATAASAVVDVLVKDLVSKPSSQPTLSVQSATASGSTVSVEHDCEPLQSSTVPVTASSGTEDSVSLPPMKTRCGAVGAGKDEPVKRSIRQKNKMQSKKQPPPVEQDSKGGKQEEKATQSVSAAMQEAFVPLLPKTEVDDEQHMHHATLHANASLPGGMQPTVVDSSGLRLYTFLHPVNYNRNHGVVLLDYCCANLENLMHAVDPTRDHSQVQMVVRELPTHIVLTTKVITRADLDEKNHTIPASIRKKMEKLTSVVASSQGAIEPSPSKKMAIATSSTKGSSTCPTDVYSPKTYVSQIQKPICSTTFVARSATPSVNPTATSSLPASTSSSGLQSDILRTTRQTLLRRFDLMLKKYSGRICALTLAEREQLLDEILQSTTLSAQDLQKTNRLLEDYCQLIGKLPTLAKSAADATSTAIASTSGAQLKTTATCKLTTVKRQVPIYDKDSNVIGYRMQVCHVPQQQSSGASRKSTQSSVSASLSQLLQVPPRLIRPLPMAAKTKVVASRTFAPQAVTFSGHDDDPLRTSMLAATKSPPKAKLIARTTQLGASIATAANVANTDAECILPDNERSVADIKEIKREDDADSFIDVT